MKIFRMLLSFAICLIVICAAIPATFAASEGELVEVTLGDVDDDGKVTVKDATAVQKYLANILSLDNVHKAKADADQNQKVNIKDATAIQKFVAGIVTGYPIGEVVFCDPSAYDYEEPKCDRVEYVGFPTDTPHVMYAVITGYDESNNILWTYTTSEYTIAQVYATDKIGLKDDKYYFIENGSLVALNISDGGIAWRSDVGVRGLSGVAFGDDTIYMCGYLGPNFCAVSLADGEVLCRIKQFDTTYTWIWANNLYLNGNYAVVSVEGPYGPKDFYVNLTTYEVSDSM